MSPASNTLYAAATSVGRNPGVFPWPPEPRAPLPPVPPVTSSQGDQRVWTQATPLVMLPYKPPTTIDIRYLRSNFCGTRETGVQWKDGMAGRPGPNGEASVVMDLDIFKYRGDTTSQMKIFARKIVTGLPHYQFSIGDAIQQGWSISEFVSLASMWQALGGFADYWFLGTSPWDTPDQDWAFWQPKVQPWIDALKSAGCLTKDNATACCAWQADGWNSPMGLMSIAKGFRYALGPDILLFMHWLNDANAWWDDLTQAAYGIGNRFAYWLWMKLNNVLNGTNAQYDVNAPINAPSPGGLGGLQGAIRDVLRSFLAGLLFRPYELSGQNQFNWPDFFMEADGNLQGNLSQCVSAIGQDGTLIFPAGYGNGSLEMNGAWM